jgi:hypothetical protein
MHQALLISAVYSLPLAIVSGLFFGVIGYLIFDWNLFWNELGKTIKSVLTFVVTGWVVPILIITSVMAYLYFFSQDIEFAFSATKRLWIELISITLVASFLIMLPFPLFLNLIRNGNNTDQPKQSGRLRDTWRNLFVSACTVIAGLLSMMVLIESAMGDITAAYELSQPDVVGECGWCSLTAVLAIDIATYGAAMVIMAVSPIRTNWSPPQEISTSELIRRTCGFVIFSMSLLDFNLAGSWLLAVSGIFVLLMPNIYQRYFSDLIQKRLLG